MKRALVTTTVFLLCDIVISATVGGKGRKVTIGRSFRTKDNADKLDCTTQVGVYSHDNRFNLAPASRPTIVTFPTTIGQLKALLINEYGNELRIGPDDLYTNYHTTFIVAKRTAPGLKADPRDPSHRIHSDTADSHLIADRKSELARDFCDGGAIYFETNTPKTLNLSVRVNNAPEALSAFKLTNGKRPWIQCDVRLSTRYTVEDIVRQCVAIAAETSHEPLNADEAVLRWAEYGGKAGRYWQPNEKVLSSLELYSRSVYDISFGTAKEIIIHVTNHTRESAKPTVTECRCILGEDNNARNIINLCRTKATECFESAEYVKDGMAQPLADFNALTDDGVVRLTAGINARIAYGIKSKSKQSYTSGHLQCVTPTTKISDLKLPNASFGRVRLFEREALYDKPIKELTMEDTVFEFFRSPKPRLVFMSRANQKVIVLQSSRAIDKLADHVRNLLYEESYAKRKYCNWRKHTSNEPQTVVTVPINHETTVANICDYLRKNEKLDTFEDGFYQYDIDRYRRTLLTDSPFKLKHLRSADKVLSALEEVDDDTYSNINEPLPLYLVYNGPRKNA